MSIVQFFEKNFEHKEERVLVNHTQLILKKDEFYMFLKVLTDRLDQNFVIPSHNSVPFPLLFQFLNPLSYEFVPILSRHFFSCTFLFHSCVAVLFTAIII